MASNATNEWCNGQMMWRMSNATANSATDKQCNGQAMRRQPVCRQPISSMPTMGATMASSATAKVKRYPNRSAQYQLEDRNHSVWCWTVEVFDFRREKRMWGKPPYTPPKDGLPRLKNPKNVQRWKDELRKNIEDCLDSPKPALPPLRRYLLLDFRTYHLYS